MGYKNIPDYGAGSWKDPVATQADLPASGNTLGDARVVQNTTEIYVWNGSGWDNETSGDVGGPASSTDSAIALFDGTTGKTLKNSLVTIDSSANAAGYKSITMSPATGKAIVINNTTLGTTANERQVITIDTITANTTASTTNTGILLNINRAGNNASRNFYGIRVDLTGASSSTNDQLVGNNVNMGASTNGSNINGFNFNRAYEAATFGSTTTGVNVSYVGITTNANKNYGAILRAQSAVGSNPTNIGVASFADSSTGASLFTAGYFKISNGANLNDLPTVTAALIADNGDSEQDILRCLSQNTLAFSIAGNGNIATNQLIPATTPGSIVSSIPIFDATNTLIGYIPVYDSIT